MIATLDYEAMSGKNPYFQKILNKSIERYPQPPHSKVGYAAIAKELNGKFKKDYSEGKVRRLFNPNSSHVSLDLLKDLSAIKFFWDEERNRAYTFDEIELISRQGATAQEFTDSLLPDIETTKYSELQYIISTIKKLSTYQAAQIAIIAASRALCCYDETPNYRVASTMETLNHRECKRLAILLDLSSKHLASDPIARDIPQDIWGYFDSRQDFSEDDIIQVPPETMRIIAGFCLRVREWQNDIPRLDKRTYAGDYIKMLADIRNGCESAK